MGSRSFHSLLALLIHLDYSVRQPVFLKICSIPNSSFETLHEKEMGSISNKFGNLAYCIPLSLEESQQTSAFRIIVKNTGYSQLRIAPIFPLASTNSSGSYGKINLEFLLWSTESHWMVFTGEETWADLHLRRLHWILWEEVGAKLEEERQSEQLFSSAITWKWRSFQMSCGVTVEPERENNKPVI